MPAHAARTDFQFRNLILGKKSIPLQSKNRHEDHFCLVGVLTGFFLQPAVASR